jgi:hypothetical protein
MTHDAPPGASRNLLSEIRAHYREMPGLVLTRRQACRLFAVGEAEVVRAFTNLVREGFLQQLKADRYALADRA